MSNSFSYTAIFCNKKKKKISVKQLHCCAVMTFVSFESSEFLNSMQNSGKQHHFFFFFFSEKIRLVAPIDL